MNYFGIYSKRDRHFGPVEVTLAVKIVETDAECM